MMEKNAMEQIALQNRVTITLDRRLIDMIIQYQGFNRQNYINWNKPSSMAFGIEEKLYEILDETNEMVETAKLDLLNIFTIEEALLLFVCLSNQSLHEGYWDKPGRDIQLLIDCNKDELNEFYDGDIPMSTVNSILNKAESLTRSECNALVKSANRMRFMSKDEILKFSTTDIAHHFGTIVDDDYDASVPEKWYEIELLND
jgi:hypothetical protein